MPSDEAFSMASARVSAILYSIQRNAPRSTRIAMANKIAVA